MDTSPLLEAIERELQQQVARLEDPLTGAFQEMLTYQMGWTGEGAGLAARGKRIRPLLVLLSVAGCGQQWLRALPGAAAIELIHNFSLVHDDVQDQSRIRRGRSTVWVRWGVPMAINVGDALFVLAQRAVLELKDSYAADRVTAAARILDDACLALTRGQFLDLSYEGRTDLSVDDYWPVVRGKTAALLAAACHTGALLGDADENRQESFRSFGEHLGLAFQVQDDILGIWGEESVTGKSAASDLLEAKNSLPVLFGLARKDGFAALWKKGRLQPSDVGHAAAMLAQEGAEEFALTQAAALTSQALHDLENAAPDGEAGAALFELAASLLKRKQ
ncbi:MAG TPA: polyprenyl synthetase family protein [Anaerolineales bacterium]|jgi:geranylgeranyl diphosphate synthase type I